MAKTTRFGSLMMANGRMTRENNDPVTGALKMQDRKMQDQIAGDENAGPENAGPNRRA